MGRAAQLALLARLAQGAARPRLIAGVRCVHLKAEDPAARAVQSTTRAKDLVHELEVSTRTVRGRAKPGL